MRPSPSPAPRLPRRVALAAVAGTLALLGGCAALRTVHSEVSTFGQWPAGRPAGTYAIERLPSQLPPTPQHDEVEQAARQGLEAAGFAPVPEGGTPQYTVQIGARITRFDRSPWDDPLWWRPPGYGRYAPWPGAYSPFWGWRLGTDRPEYVREVGLLIRDKASGEPLYEARARSDGATAGGAALLGAMFTAALQDFPATRAEPHDVAVVLP